MVAAALWLPHEWDWDAWEWLSQRHPPTFDAAEISIVDVPWGADIAVDRRRIAAFLNELVDRRQHPPAVVLDVQFKPCDTQPCEPAMESARQALIAAIRKATTASINVFALEQPILHISLGDADEATGLEPHDADIYAALTGAAHTKFIPLASGAGLFYRACYDSVPVVDQNGNIVVRAVWDMVERVQMRSVVFARARCDTEHVPVRLPEDPQQTAAADVVTLSAQGLFSASTQFTDRYVIVGTIENDPGFAARNLPGPELLAWALSNALEPGSVENAEATYDTEPQGTKLLLLVPTFSAVTLAVFIAIFYLLKGTQLRSLRRALPWIAAVASTCVGLGALALFEFWELSTRHIQPQITLITLGIVASAVLASLRAFQVLFQEQWGVDTPLPETYDYDVFVSYAHDEGAWVAEHVYAKLRDARLADGRKLSVFFDTDAIRFGTAWQDKIALAIDGSRFILPVYSEIYFKKPYCQFEIRRAHRKWIKTGVDSRCVLPIVRGKPKVPSTVDDIQWKSLEEMPDLVDQIVAEIVERLSRAGKPVAASNPTEATAT